VLPPLREREDDVELLARTFVDRIAKSYGLPVPELSQEARTSLRAHRWPGNVRELRNVLERAVVLSPPGTLRLGPLDEARGRADSTSGVLPFPAPLAEVVRTAAHAMLDLTGGNKSEAARRLGISRPRLQRLLDGNLED
jgi:DNA-binding NtrC family response regulator